MSRERDISLSEIALSDTTTYEVVTIEQYKRECHKLEEVVTRILGPKLERNTMVRLMSKHTTVPTYYQLVKTHKLVREENSVDITSIKRDQ